VADGAAIADLISLLDLKPERVAVELNRKILRRVEWSGATLNDGDRVEIVHFVGGGC
jgi:sulfur carrier protein